MQSCISFSLLQMAKEKKIMFMMLLRSCRLVNQSIYNVSNFRSGHHVVTVCLQVVEQVRL